MKITIDRSGDGVHLTVERESMPESRFKALCGLAAAGVCAGMVVKIAALCGTFGVLVTAVIALFALLIVKGLD